MGLNFLLFGRRADGLPRVSGAHTAGEKWRELMSSALGSRAKVRAFVTRRTRPGHGVQIRHYRTALCFFIIENNRLDSGGNWRNRHL